MTPWQLGRMTRRRYWIRPSLGSQRGGQPRVPALALKQDGALRAIPPPVGQRRDRKSTRLNSSHVAISYAVFCLKKKKNESISELLTTFVIHMLYHVALVA